MQEWCERTAALIGKDAVLTLKTKRVAIFGVGGVGGFAAEALIRAGVGELTLVDGDVVTLSNLNRQIIALTSTIGKNKAEVMGMRAKEINPEVITHIMPLFFGDSTAKQFDFSSFDYVVDAVDDIAAKVLLAKICTEQNIPIISAMGAALRMDPLRFRVADISQTSVCPLARRMRKALKEEGIYHLKVVFSDETPKKPEDDMLGSISFVPSVAGLVLAGEVIKDFIK